MKASSVLLKPMRWAVVRPSGGMPRWPWGTDSRTGSKTVISWHAHRGGARNLVEVPMHSRSSARTRATSSSVRRTAVSLELSLPLHDACGGNVIEVLHRCGGGQLLAALHGVWSQQGTDGNTQSAPVAPGNAVLCGGGGCCNSTWTVLVCILRCLVLLSPVILCTLVNCATATSTSSVREERQRWAMQGTRQSSHRQNVTRLKKTCHGAHQALALIKEH